MRVSKDVIRDLLPVYSAGEASADTQALVEEYLARDPELRALADGAKSIQIPDLERTGATSDVELKTLNRTRRLLARKSFVLGIALLFTLLPMTVVFRNGDIVLVLARDYPDMASGLLLNAFIAWLVYLDTCRRLRATGLQASQSRVLWTLVGAALGVGTMLVARHWAGGHLWPAALPPVFAGLAFVFSVLWTRMGSRRA